MNKLFYIAPAVLLFACGETTNEENTEEVQQEVVEQVEEVIEPTETTPDVDAEVLAFLEGKSWENQEPHESGMYIVIDEAGEGDARPTLADEVTIYYQGYLMNGFKFDGTQDAPATFPLSHLIEGWQIGIPHFGKGGKGKLIIPSDLAYGDMDRGDIPGGSTLMFEIELIDWNSAQ
ncbi:FKBP-type peptidyl-prolyl cis-trans isomerase [Crocinitomix algicola]|uniref:FKBP-type peptidyl-prolyl cis-trans isomerase n=1 Tax=Crocinitomix algicola TaxID=1740263 RepID=UPI00082BDF21|nr:FKBP-type peptidyl-prolyl cis-trans isomerase [Crocinitomix algicola]